MVIIEITGGLGNQMFQYAFGRTIATLNNTELLLDTTHFEKNQLRKFELFNFQVNARIANSNEIAIARMESSKYDILKRKVKTLISPYYRRAIINQGVFEFDPNYLKIKSPVYVTGYWQSARYFSPVDQLIKTELNYNQPLSDAAQNYYSKMQVDTPISMHIRRGDYINNQTTNLAHGLCSKEYYLQAIHRMRKTCPNALFFVFSDDILWAIENFSDFDRIVFVDGLSNPIEELKLMSKCTHNIIANSSFSWWGAYLNPNTQKQVIAPYRWFFNRKDNTSDVIPPEWIKIDG